MTKKFYGILTSISWNSNNWSCPATNEDILKSNYAWVKQNHRMMEDLNLHMICYLSKLTDLLSDILQCSIDHHLMSLCDMYNSLF
jgi:hypothetical protein